MKAVPIDVERRGPLGVIRLNRPERANTITLQMTIDFNDALDELDADEGVFCILITGAGEKHFCGGADLREIQDLISPDGVTGDRRRDFIRHIEEISKPVIAAINGAAMGGGCEIALACDFRLMADSAQVGLPEIRFGALPAAGGTQRLPRLVGLAKAKDIILLGRTLTADQALACGLVDRIAPAADLMDMAYGLAAELSELAPYALAAGKRLLNAAFELPLAEGLILERQTIHNMATDKERESFRSRSMQKSSVYKNIFSPSESVSQ